MSKLKNYYLVKNEKGVEKKPRIFASDTLLNYGDYVKTYSKNGEDFGYVVGEINCSKNTMEKFIKTIPNAYYPLAKCKNYPLAKCKKVDKDDLDLTFKPSIEELEKLVMEMNIDEAIDYIKSHCRDEEETKGWIIEIKKMKGIKKLLEFEKMFYV